MPTPRNSTGGAGVGFAPVDIGPEQKPDAKHDGASAGEWLSDGELPVVAVPGGTPMTTGGYSPASGQEPLPTPGSGNEGFPKAPAGVRR